MTPSIILCIAAFVATGNSTAPSYGDSVALFPKPLVSELAAHHAPSESGAMGRNKKGYFHVRFQSGLHHLADFGLVTHRSAEVARFLNAAEYALRHQLGDGDFSLEIPRELRGMGSPSSADRASGVAFFASSLGAGIRALETNEWFMQAEECEALRQRLRAMDEGLRMTLNYLVQHRQELEVADGRAPNRLLFDALAFYSLGQSLHEDAAIAEARVLVRSALSQVHDAGYFIEGEGFDSSYNGVATALCYRLVLIGYREDDLEEVCRGAVEWQKGRVGPDGEIKTAGNSRVDPHGQGESFLGRTKDVDIAHTVEAFMLASNSLQDSSYARLANRVLTHYLRRDAQDGH